MSKNTLKPNRDAILANLATVWPNAKLGRVSNDDLLWLALVVTCMAKPARDMSSTLQHYRTEYEPTTAYSGRKSLSCGDEVAEFLAGMSPTEVLQVAEQVLGLEDGELQTRYENLNPGQQRMNGGNRIRAALKRGDITAADLH